GSARGDAVDDVVLDDNLGHLARGAVGAPELHGGVLQVRERVTQDGEPGDREIAGPDRRTADAVERGAIARDVLAVPDLDRVDTRLGSREREAPDVDERGVAELQNVGGRAGVLEGRAIAVGILP